MELTNPTSQQISQIEKRETQQQYKSTQPTTWKESENKSDPFAEDCKHQSSSPPPQKHKTWQGQYIQDLLDGLKHKTREEKLEDAFFALDQIAAGRRGQ
jgi:hypothetical protein